MSHRYHKQLAAKRGVLQAKAQARSKHPELTPEQARAAIAAVITPRAATTRSAAPLETRLQQQRYVSGPESPPVTESEFSARVNVYSGAIALGVPSAPSAESVFKSMKGDIKITCDGREIGKLIALELSASADEGGVISGEVQLTAAGKATVRAALPGVTLLTPVYTQGSVVRLDLDAPRTTPDSAARAQAEAHSRLSARQREMFAKLGWG